MCDWAAKIDREELCLSSELLGYRLGICAGKRRLKICLGNCRLRIRPEK